MSAAASHLARTTTFALRAVLGGSGAAAFALLLHSQDAIPESLGQLMAGVGALVAFIGAAVAINGQRRATAMLDQVASNAVADPLTGLANRVHFFGELESRLEASGTLGWAVLMIDLDGFKEVNTVHGHHVGDEVLIEVARRIKGLADPKELVARISGAEFAIAFPFAENGIDLVMHHRLDEIVVGLKGPYRTSEGLIDTNGSVGVAIAPRDGTTIDSLVRRADVAMVRARQSRAGWASFDVAMESRDSGRVDIASELARAIETGEVTVRYQPQVDALSGAVVGVEALARWTHPSLGEIPPQEFVRVAEQSGLIHDLSMLVLSQALGQARSWKLAGHRLAVTVNMSVQDVMPILGGKVKRLLSDFGLGAGDLLIELSESGIRRDLPMTRAILGLLNGVGVVLALDDNSATRATAADLSGLPLHAVKLERSIVSTVTTDFQSLEAARQRIELGKALGVPVIAVGVETTTSCEMLVKYGVDQLQGFFICPPLPASELESWLIVESGAERPLG